MGARCGSSFMTHFCDELNISKSKRCDCARWCMDTDARPLVSGAELVFRRARRGTNWRLVTWFRARTLCALSFGATRNRRGFRALNMLLCDFTTTASVCAFSSNDTRDMALAVPPIRVDTATDAGGGVVHVTEREVTILRGVELGMLGRGTNSSGEPEQQDGGVGMSQ